MSVYFFSKVSSLCLQPTYTVYSCHLEQTVHIPLSASCSDTRPQVFLVLSCPQMSSSFFGSGHDSPLSFWEGPSPLLNLITKGFSPFHFPGKYIQTYTLCIHIYIYTHTYIHGDMHIYAWVLWHICVFFMLKLFIFFKYYLANDVWMDQCTKQMPLCQITEY